MENPQATEVCVSAELHQNSATGNVNGHPTRLSVQETAWSHQRREGGGCWGRCAVGVIRILAFQHKEFRTMSFKAWVFKREDLRFFCLVLAVK